MRGFCSIGPTHQSSIYTLAQCFFFFWCMYMRPLVWHTEGCRGGVQVNVPVTIQQILWSYGLLICLKSSDICRLESHTPVVIKLKAMQSCRFNLHERNRQVVQFDVQVPTLQRNLLSPSSAYSLDSQLCFKKHYGIKTYGRGDVCTHVFLSSALHRSERQTSRFSCLPPGEEASVSFRQKPRWGPKPTFYREVLGHSFLQNAFTHLPKYTTSHPGRSKTRRKKIDDSSNSIHDKDHRCNPVHIKEVCLKEKKVNLPLYLRKHHVMKAYGGWGFSSTYPSPRLQSQVSHQLHPLIALPLQEVHRAFIGREAGRVRNPTLWRNFNDIHTVQ